MRSYESINVFVFSSFYCNNYDLFYTVQAASSKITQISIDNHLEYDCEKVSKLRSKVKNMLKKSVLALSVLHNIACNYKFLKIRHTARQTSFFSKTIF